MTTVDLAAPFPYFGGKRRAAPAIWSLLGDPGGYVEPFAGSAAALLARPVFTGRRVETINDKDGWLINMWRAIQLDPLTVAKYAVGPVSEIDYHARLAWLQARRDDRLVSWLEGDPEHFDAKAAGWWLTVVAAGIGDPFGSGPWIVDDGHLINRKKLPHLGDAGQGVNRELPHLGDAGQGVNRELPHLGNAGRGVEAYLLRLQARLARVRITCGTWKRVVQPSITRAKTGGDKSTAILLDPPYSIGGDLYAADTDTGIDQAVNAWCQTGQAQGHRIVLCGFNDDHDNLIGLGWTKHLGKSGGGAGYNTDGKAGRRERLWASPECLNPEQKSLFDVAI